jgi:hypothetical protein
MSCLIPGAQIPADVSAGWPDFMQWPPVISTSSLHFFSSYTKMCINSHAPSTECDSSRILSPECVQFVSHHTSRSQIRRWLLYFLKIWRTFCLVTLTDTTGCVPPLPCLFLNSDTAVVFSPSTIICLFCKMEHKNGFYQIPKLFPASCRHQQASSYYLLFKRILHVVRDCDYGPVGSANLKQQNLWKSKIFHVTDFAFYTFSKQNDAIPRKHPSPRSCVPGDQFLPFIMYPTPLCLVGLFRTGCS